MTRRRGREVDFVKTARAGKRHADRATSKWLAKMKREHPAEYVLAVQKLRDRGYDI